MATKDRIEQLGRRLDTIREEFSLREYKWSLGLIESQIPNDDSLFWRLPNHLVRNLQKVLGRSRDERVRFFLTTHAYRYRKLVEKLGMTVPDITEQTKIEERCMGPTALDVREHGLLPFPGTLGTSAAELNKRALRSAVRKYLEPVWKAKVEFNPSDFNESVYRAQYGPWFITTHASTRPFQLQLEHDIGLGSPGRGDALYLKQQISLHGVLATLNVWDIAKRGEEEQVARLAAEYCRFFQAALPELLDGLDPGISRAEVEQAEEQWLEWFEKTARARALLKTRQ